MRPRFWELPLSELSISEWEALCDHCGRCCLHKLQDEEDDQVYFTDVVCRLYDRQGGGCRDYARRQQQVPDCLSIRDEGEAVFVYLPRTCAYRLRYESQPLPAWHPLLNGGDTRLMHEAGVNLQQQVVSETELKAEADLEERIIHWVEA